jgi:predicted dehydrogenase
VSFKVIIAGAGLAGSLHLKACQSINAIEVIAVCDPDLDRAKGLAKQNSVPYVFTSLEDALKAQTADIVHVCSPPSNHFELCRLALECGCHVLVEKPIFENLEEAEEIREIVNKSGRKFSAVHNGKYQEGMQQAKNLVKEGYIGELRQINAVRMLNGNNDRMALNSKSWCHKLPGGRWEELIAHPIYKARQFMGPMRFVHLEMKRVHNHWPWLPADELEVILESNGGYVSINLSANANNYNFMFLYGSKRFLYVDHMLAVEPLYQIFTRNYKKLLSFMSKRFAFALGFRSKFFHQDAHASLIKDFIAYVQGEHARPPVDWEEAINTLELGLQIGKEIQRRKEKY